MTIDEFNGTKWKLGMAAIYHGRKYNVAATNFAECLVALLDSETNGILMWVRCENVELTEAATPKFPNVSCSQCGKEFGPGNSGFSHCANHE